MPKLYYKDINQESKNIVLLIHGLGVNSESWRFQTKDLVKAGYRVIAVDLEGFGASNLASKSVSIIKSVLDIDNIINDHNFTNITIIGLSLGGVIALQYAITFPEKVTKLIVINALAKLPKEKLSQKLYIFFRLLLAYLLPIQLQSKIVSSFSFPNHENLRQACFLQMKQSDVSAYRQYLKILTKIDMISDLKKISAETLILASKQDRVISNKCSETLHKNIKNSHIKYIDGSHTVIADNPDQTNQEIVNFLKL